MLFTHGVIVDIASPPLREAFLAALRAVMPEGESALGLEPLAVVRGSADPGKADGLPVVRLWNRGREPGGDNPFVDPATRHVLGTAPVIDRGILASTLAFLARGMPIGLASLVPTPRVARRLRLERPEDRPAHAETLRAAMLEGGVAARLTEELSTLIDELVQNCLYDAPTDGTKSYYRAVSRTIPVPVVKPVDLSLAIDDFTVAVSVRDYFGSLSAEHVVANLQRCYAGSAGQIDAKWGGAGLGLYMALAGSTRLVFNIAPGAMTEVLLTRNFRQRPAEFGLTAPSLNLCVAAGLKGAPRS